MVRRTRCSALILLLLCLLAPAAQAAVKTFTVVIDAGHGGHDAGAVGTFAKEKDINLNIALKVGKLITEQLSDVKVVYTRDKDVFIALGERAKIANRINADLFLSIHTNSVENKARSPQGVETYSLGLARSEANLAVAKRENAVILLEKDYKERYAGFNPNSSESYIIFEFMQDKYMEQSVHMASLVQTQMKNHSGRTDKGVKQAGFLVLRETSMPSVLIELGFISHREEERYLTSEVGAGSLAQSIFRAFREYKTEHDLRTGKATSTTTAATPPPTPIRQQPTQETTTPVAPTSVGKEVSGDTPPPPVFKVQVLTSSSLIPPTDKRFQGLTPITSYTEQSLYKYTYGEDTDYNKIYALRKQILDRFPTAFIVAFRGSERMDVQEAIRIFKTHK
jgi:N-acetylmuramoyl-L-alanine amidase